jgi:hypothetical protein
VSRVVCVNSFKCVNCVMCVNCVRCGICGRSTHGVLCSRYGMAMGACEHGRIIERERFYVREAGEISRSWTDQVQVRKVRIRSERRENLGKRTERVVVFRFGGAGALDEEAGDEDANDAEQRDADDKEDCGIGSPLFGSGG